jgi:hypothetical protein
MPMDEGQPQTRRYLGRVRQTRPTWVQIVRLPPEGVTAFQEYEAAVIPLLPDHGGRFEARYRGQDGQVEIHVVSFASSAGMEAYMADQRRLELRPRLLQSGAQAELIEVTPIDLP